MQTVDVVDKSWNCVEEHLHAVIALAFRSKELVARIDTELAKQSEQAKYYR